MLLNFVIVLVFLGLGALILIVALGAISAFATVALRLYDVAVGNPDPDTKDA